MTLLLMAAKISIDGGRGALVDIVIKNCMHACIMAVSKFLQCSDFATQVLQESFCEMFHASLHCSASQFI